MDTGNDGKVREGELEFCFPGCRIERFDAGGRATPQGMKLVDFVIDSPDGCRRLVEVKDPSNSTATQQERIKFAAALNTGLIENKLVPKCRDSCHILYLMARDLPDCHYVVVIGTERINLDKDMLLHASEKLADRLEREMNEPWARPYVRSGIVVNLETWNERFSGLGFTVTRM